MESVFFNPFIGSTYKEGGIMLLGEAHICGECSCDDCLQNKDDKCVNGHVTLVEKHIAKGDVPTYARFEKEFCGKEIKDADEREKFWNQFLFTNFLPISMPQSREAPESRFYSDECRERFLNYVGQYKPSHIIVWGERTWSNLPGDPASGMWEKSHLSKFGDFDVWKLKYGEVRAKTIVIYHPAYIGMSNEDFKMWKNRIDCFLAE